MANRAPLVSASVDTWLVGGAAIAFWFICSGLRVLDHGGPPAITGIFYAAVIGAVACHFGVAYHLAYADKESGPRAHPLALVAVPAAMASLGVVVWAYPHSRATSDVLRLLITTVYATTVWHYVKQNYGVSRLGAALSGKQLGRYDAALLRYGLYPLWGYSLTRLVTRHAAGSLLGYKVGFDLVGPWLEHAAMALVIVSGLLFLAGPVRRYPAAVWTPGVAGFLWVAWQPSYVSTALVLGGAHAVQYLACAYRAERTWSDSRDQAQPVLWLLCVFTAATVVGLFASMWLAPLVSSVTGVPLGPLAAFLFVALNLHHYAVDAVIWRSGGSHLRRIVATRHTAAAPLSYVIA